MILAGGAPNQELDSSFCRWIAWQRLAKKDFFFTDTGVGGRSEEVRESGEVAIRREVGGMLLR